MMQALVETAQSPEVSVTLACATIVGLGKVWDKVVGHNRDRDAKRRQDELSRRLDEHAFQDSLSFNAIHTSMAVVESGLGQITKQLDTIEKRQYEARGE